MICVFVCVCVCVYVCLYDMRECGWVWVCIGVFGPAKKEQARKMENNVFSLEIHQQDMNKNPQVDDDVRL